MNTIIDKNFADIDYLKYGNKKQKESYDILKKINIFNILKKYSPILVGTIPLGIDIGSSDLDIVCKVTNFIEFEELLNSKFGKHKNYSINLNECGNILVCNFYVDNIDIEIYGSEINSKDTNGYRHMMVEYRILNIAEDGFKEDIINLKRNGSKTEPAFAKVLNLQGNPYEELLKLDKYCDKKLLDLINRML